jgi:hypothetical protein
LVGRDKTPEKSADRNPKKKVQFEDPKKKEVKEMITT